MTQRVFSGNDLSSLHKLDISSNVTRGIWDYRWNALRGGLSKGSQPVFMRVLEKTMEIPEWLVHQSRPVIELAIACLPVLSAEPLGHWWDSKVTKTREEHEKLELNEL